MAVRNVETHTVHFAGKGYSVTVESKPGLRPHADSLVDAVVSYLNGRKKTLVRYSSFTMHYTELGFVEALQPVVVEAR